MLHNPKWDVTTEIFSLASFISWLETMPTDGWYSFADCRGGCMMGQYMAAHGREWNDANYTAACLEVFGSTHFLPALTGQPRTFGAALERALALPRPEGK